MRTFTNVVLVLVGLALLSACAESTSPEAEVVKDCMTSSGQWYNCESPSDTLPACRVEVGCVPILPPPKDM